MMSEVQAEEFDKYGFLKAAGYNEEADYRCHDFDDSEEKHDDSPDKSWDAWKILLGKDQTIGTRLEAIDLLKTSGIPHSIRGMVWQKLLGVDAWRKDHSKFDYTAECVRIEELCVRRREAAAMQTDEKAEGGASEDAPKDEEAPQAKDVQQIELDLDRTFYTHSMFMEKDGLGQQKLRRILRAYAAFDKETGYCQGMAYIAAVLLMILSEEEAFWTFSALLGSPKYLQGFYSNSLSEVQRSANVLTGLIARRMPALSIHLAQLNVHPLMYVTPWFMCLFTSLPHWDTVLGIWDILMLNGVETIYRTALAIMELCKDELIASEGLSTLLPYLQHLPPSRVHRNSLLSAIWEIHELELAGQVAMVKDVIKSGQNPQECLPEVWLAKVQAAKRAREEEAMERQRKRRRKLQAQSGPESTPSVFQRFFSRLATPLRSRVREDSGKSSSSPLSSVPFPSLQTPMRTPASKPPSLPAILSPIPSNVVPATACSPSFGRSGILSPSYNADTSLLSPLASILETKELSTPGTFKSPGHNMLLDTASPSQRQSFLTFTKQTPLRPSQRATPSSRSKSTALRDRNTSAFTPMRKGRSMMSMFAGTPRSQVAQEGALGFEMTPVSTAGKRRKKRRRESLSSLPVMPALQE